MAVMQPQPVPMDTSPRMAEAVLHLKRYPVLPTAILLLLLVIPAIFASQVAP